MRGHVDEARRAANERARPGEQLRHRLEAALGDGARAIGDAAAALEHGSDQRMVLEALELAIGIEVRIGIVEMHNEADRYQIVSRWYMKLPPPVLIPSGQPMVWVTWPWRWFSAGSPRALHADAELLRFAAFGEVELRDDLLGERAPHALGDEDIFAKELHAGLKSSLGWPILADPMTPADNAPHRASSR